MSTAPTVIKTTEQLRELPVGSVVEASAVGAVTGHEFVIGCQRMYISAILRAGGSIAPEGRGFRATAPLLKGHSGRWNLGHATPNFSGEDVIDYAEVTLKEPVESPDDLVLASMSPGLYHCSAFGHTHQFILHTDGEWSTLNPELTLATADGPGAGCALSQGVGARFVGAHLLSNQTHNVLTTVRRKHVVGKSQARRGTVLRMAR